jgi:general nucleoside transport system ATP-binding protein
VTDRDGRGPAAGATTGSPAAAAVVLRGITKRFGAVVACSAVDLVVERGEIHGLLGENGAGKSTLMKILTGVVPPDAGQIVIDGHHRTVADPMAAAALGMAMVHQHFSLIEPLTVWENVTLGERGRVDVRAAIRQVEEIGERYGLAVDPRARVGDLTAGQRQRVEIIKCFRRNPSVVILDEPTSVLTVAESRELFRVLREVVAAEGRAVVLISHKLDEILSSTDRVTIMRGGVVVGSGSTGEATAAGLARAMVGRDVSLRVDAAAVGMLGRVAAEVATDDEPAAPAAGVERSQPSLRIRDAVAVAADGRVLLDGLSLDVHPGEILGLAGVEGNGQATVGDLLSSLVELRSGAVEIDGRPVPTGRAGMMGDSGVGVVPEDRHGSGCVLGMTVAENLVLDDLQPALSGRWISPKRLRAHAERLIGEFGIQTSSWDAPMWSLSGGNQQRVVLARELSRRPRVLVAAQPTRGLDVGAIEYMSERLRDAAGHGVAILLVSTELEEILALSDRIAVIHRGRIVGEMDRHEVDVERLGLLMGGHAA